MRLLLVLLCLCIISCDRPEVSCEIGAKSVLIRSVGARNADRFKLNLVEDSVNTDWYSITTSDTTILINANTPVALCRGAYDYLKNNCNSIVSWSGTKVNMPDELPVVNEKVNTSFQFRYYFNVVTHGYTTPYWDWNRWEQEIDWMALHGINMPLIGGAHEAILYRVFKQLGLSKEDIEGYFSGPAHFPWNRMGNLVKWDGPPPNSFYTKQIALTHQILDRLSELQMKPIIHAFAGFVPRQITNLYPDAEIRELAWGGGLPEVNNAFLLSPGSTLFNEIGTLYIQEWEKEFGKADYYLADSFNEMDVPLSENGEDALNELAQYGSSVYQSIRKANPQATWVMQGWTFPYHRDENGNRFWTSQRLEALVSEVPDEKLLILDLANEYNRAFWKIDPSWKMYDGFFNKKWIYSFIPNMGGKVALNGILDLYATIPYEALAHEDKKNLVGFGFAPEGIENNEIVYELLSDVAWNSQGINLDDWIRKYALQRYGAYPKEMEQAFNMLRKSAFGTFTDHPMHRYQFRPYEKPEGVENHATVHDSEAFHKAVALFLSCAADCKDNELFVADAIELAVQGLGLKVDTQLLEFINEENGSDPTKLDDILSVLLVMDRLLASHPNHSLERWVSFARKWGDTDAEKDYYESNAKRLITTWGGDPVNDYSGRIWSGLIRDYYVPRWRKFHTDVSDNSKKQMRQWEEEWILNPGVSTIKPYDDPLSVAIKMNRITEVFSDT